MDMRREAILSGFEKLRRAAEYIHVVPPKAEEPDPKELRRHLLHDWSRMGAVNETFMPYLDLMIDMHEKAFRAADTERSHLRSLGRWEALKELREEFEFWRSRE